MPFLGATYQILVEKIKDHVGQSSVTPVTVNKQQFVEVSELSNRKITCHHSLKTSIKGVKSYYYSIKGYYNHLSCPERVPSFNPSQNNPLKLYPLSSFP